MTEDKSTLEITKFPQTKKNDSIDALGMEIKQLKGNLMEIENLKNDLKIIKRLFYLMISYKEFRNNEFLYLIQDLLIDNNVRNDKTYKNHLIEVNLDQLRKAIKKIEDFKEIEDLGPHEVGLKILRENETLKDHINWMIRENDGD